MVSRPLFEASDSKGSLEGLAGSSTAVGGSTSLASVGTERGERTASALSGMCPLLSGAGLAAVPAGPSDDVSAPSDLAEESITEGPFSVAGASGSRGWAWTGSGLSVQLA